MSSVEDFESSLKDVVEAKRLSQSKMKKLTDNALKCMKYDTQLVSILYRTHKTLSPAQKLSSLYVFDALARAARHQVTKQDAKADLKVEKDNCSSFLLKMEGVLDGLFQDMVTLDHPDAKEKTKKILDIWTKSNTFPPEILARLSKFVTEQDRNKNKVAGTVTADPRQQTTPPITVPTLSQPTTTTTPPQLAPMQASTPTNDVQSTLLALLSQAANAVSNNGQTMINTAAPISIPQLDANQFAMFQHLAQTAKAGNAVPTQPLPLPVSLVPSATANVPPVAPPNGGPPQSLPYRDDHFGSGRRDSKYDRFDGPERARDRDDYYDDRRNFRGDFRGRYNRGVYRGHGAGRGRWDDREQYSDGNRERDWNSPPGGRYSRSRSPSHNRFTGRREGRPYSPPRRPSSPQPSSAHPPFSGGPALQTFKDEFGRDIRPQTPSQDSRQTSIPPNSTSASVPGPSSVASVDESVSSEKPSLPVSMTQTPALQTDPTSAVASSSAISASQNQVGLDAFDYTTFNPMEPSSWEALGKAWAVTNGYLPSQEELMQFVMGANMFIANQFGMPQQQGIQSWSDNTEQNWNRGQTSRGRARGRGGFGRGNGRGGEWGYSGDRRSDDRGTDAVTLGGGEEMDGSNGMNHEGHEMEMWQKDQQQSAAWSGEGQGHSIITQEGHSQSEQTNEDGSATGRMQKVGDKWIFVRRGETTAEVS